VAGLSLFPDFLFSLFSMKNSTVVPVSFTSPDGLEIVLRATLGARKRIKAMFGKADIASIFASEGDGCLPDLAHCLAFDTDGNPPAWTSAGLGESLSTEGATELLGFILSAFSQGKLDPNVAAEVLKEMVDGPLGEAMLSSTLSAFGSSSGPSAEPVSA